MTTEQVTPVQIDEEFAATLRTISHDLRTPLTSIRGFTDVLRKGGERLSDADRADYLGRITAAAEKLDVLITKLSTEVKARSADQAAGSG